MRVLGISCFYHDAAAALVVDGQLVAAAEEERFSRRKHDSGFPALAVQFCLNRAGVSIHEVDYVVFYEKPLLKFERLLLTQLANFPKASGVFAKAMLTWVKDKLWVKANLAEQLDIHPDRILFSEHHLSHAASAFLCSPFSEAAILTVDGVGEWATCSWGEGTGNQIVLKGEVHFPHSLGLLYSAFTAFLGFEVNEGEYKVMGMAPYGEPRYVDRIWKMLDLAPDGSFTLDLSYFCWHHSSSQSFTPKFVEVFGAPRKPESRFVTRRTGVPLGESATTEAEMERCQYYADVASSIQKVTEEVLLHLVRALHTRTGHKNLCLAGGVALNSVANYRLLQETPFENIYVQPAAGDSGGALGAALYVANTVLNQPRSFVMEHAYWGQDFSEAQIHDFLTREHIPFTHFEDEELLLERVVADLCAERVLGWFQGRFEWGPRALGSRSIIANPRSAATRELVNVKIKFREPFRPFAPSILAERAEEYFIFPEVNHYHPPRFMLMVCPVRTEKQAEVPAITHVDGSGRLQTVHRETNPRYHRLISKFAQATGTPLILNTSFNLRGEPIVTTPANAYSTFSRSGLDALVLGNFLVRK
ncbi:carbamoyltransferase family protein [Anthocerotibacter panamensis]|uniref:carbamoyltransferase family protein n=1 Tax=Anthocerotibacter panamensis TaxID=2857077 RepID=UPI001C40154E|nr:carbamoyltransferase [Anthocerotibacter panamensis]